MYTEAQQLLSSDQEDDRCAGIELAVAIGQNPGIELLATQLTREQSTFVRRRLIAALGAWQCAHTALIAGQLLASSEAYVRNGALSIMQMLGEVAVPTLTDLISHEDCDLRKQAADALGKIAGDAACSLLIGGLGDRDPNVISACAEALGNRRDVQVVPALLVALTGTQNIWVAFAIMESLVKTGDHTILEVIGPYVNKGHWNRQQHITLAGVWAVAISQLGDERQLPTAWALYDDKVLTISQMLILLASLQERGVVLQAHQVRIENMLKKFFADQVNKKTTHEMVAAIRIASRNCPTLLEDE